MKCFDRIRTRRNSLWDPRVGQNHGKACRSFAGLGVPPAPGRKLRALRSPAQGKHPLSSHGGCSIRRRLRVSAAQSASNKARESSFWWQSSVTYLNAHRRRILRHLRTTAEPQHPARHLGKLGGSGVIAAGPLPHPSPLLEAGERPSGRQRRRRDCGAGDAENEEEGEADCQEREPGGHSEGAGRVSRQFLMTDVMGRK